MNRSMASVTHLLLLLLTLLLQLRSPAAAMPGDINIGPETALDIIANRAAARALAALGMAFCNQQYCIPLSELVPFSIDVRRVRAPHNQHALFAFRVFALAIQRGASGYLEFLIQMWLPTNSFYRSLSSPTSELVIINPESVLIARNVVDISLVKLQRFAW
ncbi:hypothetical protein AXF42_Ash016564 [Apostasia shenzhenica]|uniref:Uncharacterized protein n=1 Tax=Apostasia shenzhenica TaxID=1088818 RepID=A0A2I0AVH2_9ASPA|nr:hypothetical protein AXF42_Ash016564 [Apostasia shenzhenica]